jgi:hypothetical protein
VIPAFSAIEVVGASIKTIKAGTASTTIDMQLHGTDVTGLTAWAADATAGTRLFKVATAGATNTEVAAGSDLTVKLQINVGGLGTGEYRVRLWGTTFEA